MREGIGIITRDIQVIGILMVILQIGPTVTDIRMIILTIGILMKDILMKGIRMTDTSTLIPILTPIPMTGILTPVLVTGILSLMVIPMTGILGLSLILMAILTLIPTPIPMVTHPLTPII